MIKQKNLVCGIVAIGPNNVIGLDGKMPWHCASDLAHFRGLTTSFPCIFGRTTFENLPIRPLPNRLNIVCSSQYKNTYKNGVFYAKDIESALAQCSGADRVFICGGAQMYKYALDNDLIDVMYLTQIYNDDLVQSIKLTPLRYKYFPCDMNLFFDGIKWRAEKIHYSTGVLPTDTGTTRAEFFKCVRVR